MDRVIKLPKPLDYQRNIIDWLDEPLVKYVSFKKSRQSGGSYLMKLLVTKWALSKEKAKIGYFTPTIKLGRLFFRELTESLKPFIRDANKTELRIDFVSGSYIQFLSAESEDSIRGFQFNYVILDEAAFMKDDTFNLVIRPTFLIAGKKIVLCSTPNGANGFFYQYCNYGLEGKLGFRTKEVTIYDNPFISKEEIEAIKSQVPERVFRQEYLGEFLEGKGSVFRKTRHCIVENPRKGRYYAGIDWAKTEDSTVLTIMNEYKEVVEIFRLNGIDYTQQVKLIANKLNEYKPVLTFSEENNIGTVVNELLVKEYRGKVRVVTLDNTLKREMIENLVVAFEQNKIGILNNDTLLRELDAFTVTYNPGTKTVKYSAPNGLHDDCVISLAYAYHAASNNYKQYDIR